ncbi:MAG: dockerin type I repeat-containing protein [Clostridia bacterium]|nr:dockerin type I repeat-containing protein [Clostridia bacterium]
MKKLLSVILAAAMLTGLLALTAVAEAAPVVAFALVTTPVEEGDETVTVDLTVTLPENATGYELGSFGLELGYDTSKMALAAEPEWKITGNTMNSEVVYAKPYKMMWVSIDTADQFKAGETLIATLTFDLHLPAVLDDEYVFTLTIDENNGVYSMPSKDGTYSMILYTAEEATATGTTAKVEKGVIYGDVNDDGNVNLSDISMMLQAIAKWEIEGFVSDAGDVNADGSVNLSDVSKTLQFIAKWEGVVLGPTA